MFNTGGDLDAKSLLKGASKLSNGSLLSNEPSSIDTKSGSAKDAIRGFIQSSTDGSPSGGNGPPPTAGPPIGGPPPMGGYNYANRTNANPSSANPKPAVAEAPKFKVFNPADVLPKESNIAPANEGNNNSNSNHVIASGSIDEIVANSMATTATGAMNGGIPDSVQRQRARQSKSRSANAVGMMSGSSDTISNNISSSYNYAAGGVGIIAGSNGGGGGGGGGGYGDDWADDLSKPPPQVASHSRDEYPLDSQAGFPSNGKRNGSSSSPSFSSSSSSSSSSSRRRTNSGNNTFAGATVAASEEKVRGSSTPKVATPEAAKVVSNAAASKVTSSPGDLYGTYAAEEVVIGKNPSMKASMSAPAQGINTEALKKQVEQTTAAATATATAGAGASTEPQIRQRPTAESTQAPYRAATATATAAATATPNTAASARTAKKPKAGTNGKKLSSVRPPQLQKHVMNQQERVVSGFEKYLIFVNILLSLGIFVTIVALVSVVLVYEYDFPLLEIANDVTQQCTEFASVVSVQCTVAQNVIYSTSKQHAPWLIDFTKLAQSKSAIWYKQAIQSAKVAYSSNEVQTIVIGAKGYVVVISSVIMKNYNEVAKMISQLIQKAFAGFS